MKKNNHILWSIVVASFLGALLSLYLLITHYTTSTTVCNVGGAINCDLVNRGPFGEILGIPVAGIGVLGYLLLGGIAFALVKYKNNKENLVHILHKGATLGFLFSLWLLYAELFIIFAVCPFCMISLLLITIITTLAWVVDPNGEHYNS